MPQGHGHHAGLPAAVPGCLGAVTPAGNDNGPGLGQALQAAIGQHLDAAHGAHGAVVQADDAVAIPGEIELGPWQAEDLHGNAEFEGAEAVVGEDGHQAGVVVHLAETYQLLSRPPL